MRQLPTDSINEKACSVHGTSHQTQGLGESELQEDK